MNNADDNGSQNLVKPNSAEHAIKPGLRSGVLVMAMILGRMTVRMTVNIVAVLMRVFMNAVLMLLDCHDIAAHPVHDAAQVHDSQDDEHEGHGKLHRQAKAWRDNHAKENDCPADKKNREAVAKSPKHAEQSRAAHLAFATHDRGNGNDVIRIRGVPHAQKKAKEHERNKSDHRLFAGEIQNKRIRIHARKGSKNYAALASHEF